MTHHGLSETTTAARAMPVNTPALQAVFEQASDGIALIDDGGIIIAMNPALERLTGHTASEVIGRTSCRAVLACKDAAGEWLCDRPCPGEAALTTGLTTPCQELLVLTKDGGRVPVSASFTPLDLAPGGRRLFLLVVRDITTQYHDTQRLRHLAHLSMTDALTGLDNRRSLMVRLGGEIVRARRYHHTLSLLFMDVDHFKLYNDQHGHRRGDAALTTIGRLLKHQMRETDFAARYGGEEFVLLLPETDTPQARVLAEQLRRVIACQLEEQPPGPTGARAGLTVSIGVATFPSDADNGPGLLEEADRALYAAKAAGRNRVTCSPAKPAANDQTNHAPSEPVPQPAHHTAMKGDPP